MIQFYAPEIERTGMLPPDESRHCCKVLRHRCGDEICVIDGKGHFYNCRILDDDPRSTAIEIISASEIPDHWGVDITLAVAPTKNMDRIEWLTEKAVEIGVNRIVPVLCEHSERKVVKTERLVNIAVSAMKQSLKTRLPEISPLTPFKDFLKELSKLRGSGYFDQTQLFIGYCDDDFPRLSLAKEYRPGDNVVILIGPEGDFSPAEVAEAVNAGFIPATFGDSRLRTETAALVALETIHIINTLKK